MLRTSAAMISSPSALRYLLNLSRRSIGLPNPRLPSPPPLADLRLLSSSPSPSRSDDPLAAASSASAASNPVAGRIVRQAYSDGEEVGKESVQKGVIKGKGIATAGRGAVRWAAVAASRRGGGKAAKAAVSYVCGNCGEGSSQWWGVCCHCKAMGTLTKYVIPEPDSDSASGSDEGSHHGLRSWIPQKSKEMVPQCLPDVTKGFDQAEWRIPLPGNFGMEIARVLGGGIVPGSLTLVGGDPGVGKRSLMLQLASMLSDGSKDHGPSPVVYVSGEESIEQIGNRAERMSIRSRNLYLYSSTDIEVKECTSALLRFAKLTNIPVFLIGHVTKTGDIAGPRTLEHIVDVVLYMELGVFEMSEYGLIAVQNPSEMFLTEHDSDSEILAGLAVAVVLDGSRTFAIEVQALCVSGSRSGQVGIPPSRADVIIAVLMNQAGLKLQDNAIFLNVVSGFKLKETAGDLAIAASICSSFLEFPIPNDIAFIGEIGLGGELRTVPRMDKRVIAIAKLGYRKCIIPKTSEKLLKPLNLDIEILPCSNLKEVINTVFRPQG